MQCDVRVCLCASQLGPCAGLVAGLCRAAAQDLGRPNKKGLRLTSKRMSSLLFSFCVTHPNPHTDVACGLLLTICRLTACWSAGHGRLAVEP